MRASGLLIVSLVFASALSGCEYGRRYVNKPWGKGTYIPAMICGAAGAGVGVAIQNERGGSAEVTIHNADGTTTRVRHEDDKELWKGAVVGAPVGAIVCALVGHALFDHEAAPPTPERVAAAPAPPPTPEPVPPPSAKRIVLRGITFDFDKSDIRPESRPVLDAAVQSLRDNPNIRVSIEGHTDAIGSEKYNQALSVRRAQAVFRYLVNHGITPDRMEVVGYGESRPVADNDTDSGRAQNRRVELRTISAP